MTSTQFIERLNDSKYDTERNARTALTFSRVKGKERTRLLLLIDKHFNGEKSSPKEVAAQHERLRLAAEASSVRIVPPTRKQKRAKKPMFFDKEVMLNGSLAALNKDWTLDVVKGEPYLLDLLELKCILEQREVIARLRRQFEHKKD
jgi:hypothetical protein